jgi:hypothetical protein
VPKQFEPATWNPETQIWETGRIDLFCGQRAPFSATWPTSGMTRNGQLLPLPTPVPAIGENGCSLLPTPQARDYKGRNQRDDTSCLPGAIVHLASR